MKQRVLSILVAACMLFSSMAPVSAFAEELQPAVQETAQMVAEETPAEEPVAEPAPEITIEEPATEPVADPAPETPAEDPAAELAAAAEAAAAEPATEEPTPEAAPAETMAEEAVTVETVTAEAAAPETPAEDPAPDETEEEADAEQAETYDADPNYLTFTAKQAGSTVALGHFATVEYRLGDGDWNTYTYRKLITLANVGDTVSFKGIGVTTTQDNHFALTGKIAASGDVTSLTNGVGGDASLTEGCYDNMFQNCAALTSAPALPSTTLANACYNAMFKGCTGLTAAPALPATTLTDSCYAAMFQGCTGLTAAPALPATTLASSCYAGMFEGCTSFKISDAQTGDYTQEWRIPSTGTITTEKEYWNQGTINNTGGDYTGNLAANTTYYVIPAIPDLTISGGERGTDYTYWDGVLTVLTNTPLTISGTTTTINIVIGDGVSELAANVTIDGLTIDNDTKDTALQVAANTTLNLTVLGENELNGKNTNIQVAAGSTLNLAAESTGTLTSTYVYMRHYPSIDATGATVNLCGGTLKGKTTTNGRPVLSAAQLNVSGGRIEADESFNDQIPVIQTSGTITVSGGTHKIYSAKSVALYSTSDKRVVITGGSLNFTRQDSVLPMAENPPVDGQGQQVYLTTVTLDGVNAATKVTQLGLAEDTAYGITDVYTDAAGKLYFYLPAGAEVTRVSTTDGTYVGSVTTTADSAAVGTLVQENLTVTGGERDTDYTYKDGVITVLTNAPLTIANWVKDTATKDHIVAKSGVAVNLTLAGVNIDCKGLGTGYGQSCPINLRSSGGVSSITLADATINTLKADGDSAGILMNENTTATEGALTIKDGGLGTGVLNAIGGSDARPGIGGAGPYLTIEGGVINATGGGYCSAIGNSQNQDDGTINITGGSIKATAGSEWPVIGGGCTVNITGGNFVVGNVDARTVYGNAVADAYCVKNNGGNYPYAVVARTAVTITPTTDAEKLTQTFSTSAIDATQLFTLGANCGTATYSLATGGTGEGTITAAGVLTVTKAGTLKIQVDTAAHAEYAAGSADVVLTVKPIPLAALDLSALVTAPVKNAAPVTAITGQAGYSGTIAWNGTPAKFLGETVYTATVTLTPATNYTFAGLAANAFSCTGATSVTSTVADANGKVKITIVFPATDDCTVTKLTASGKPTKTTYNIGERFDPAGLTITADCDDGTSKVITAATAGYAVTPAKMAADTTSVVVSFGGKSTSAITVAVRENLTSITAPKAITGVANGTAKTAAALGLPSTVGIVTSTGKTKTAAVTWNVSAADYNPASSEAKTFTVNGTVELPTTMSNVNKVALTAKVSVSVKAATPKPTAAPTATPKPTTAPTATPKPTTAPTATPKPAPATDTAGFVDHLYAGCLDRNADTSGKTDWVNALTSYQISGTQAAYGFVFSKEFQDKKYSNEDYVEQLYQAVMGRTSDVSGKAAWVAKLNAGASREEVFYGFANSAEFDKTCASYGIVSKDIETFVTRFYSVCLDRKPDAGGLADWSAKLRNKEQSGRDVAYGFVFSKEFQGKNYSDEDYVEHLYASFLGRKSDAAGKAGWVNQLKNGKSREDVFNGFVGSKEFSEICAGYGINRG